MLIVNHRPPDITIPWDWIMALAARVFAYLLLFFYFLVLLDARRRLHFFVLFRFGRQLGQPANSFREQAGKYLVTARDIVFHRSFAGATAFYVIAGVMEWRTESTCVAPHQGVTSFQRIVGSIVLFFDNQSSAGRFRKKLFPPGERQSSKCSWESLSRLIFLVRDLQGNVSPLRLIPPISSVYFLVRAIEDFRRDWDERHNVHTKRHGMNRRLRYWRIKWSIERFLNRHLPS